MNLIKFYRIGDFAHILGFTVLGLVYETPVINQKAIASIFVTFFSFMYIYSINNIFDRFIDNRSKNIIAGNITPRARTWVYVLLPLLPLVVITAIYRLNIFIILISIVAGTLYSCPPFRLKKLPFVGTLMNPLIFIPFFLLGLSVNNKINLGMVEVSFLFSLYLITAQLIHEKAHIKEDKNMLTTAKIFLKKDYALVYLTLLFFVLFSFSLYLRKTTGFYFNLLNISLATATLLYRKKNNVQRYRKYVKKLSIGYGILLILLFLVLN